VTRRQPQGVRADVRRVRRLEPIPPSDPALEDAGTKLLRQHGLMATGDEPAYDEGYKEAQDRRNGVIHLEDIPEDVVDRTMMGAVAHISKRSILDCARRKRCTLRQIRILEYKCFALYNVEIAEELGVSEFTVRNDLDKAIAVMSTDPYFPLIEVLCEVFCLPYATVKAILEGY
jgi:hypothetical protein